MAFANNLPSEDVLSYGSYEGNFAKTKFTFGNIGTSNRKQNLGAPQKSIISERTSNGRPLWTKSTL